MWHENVVSLPISLITCHLIYYIQTLILKTTSLNYCRQFNGHEHGQHRTYFFPPHLHFILQYNELVCCHSTNTHRQWRKIISVWDLCLNSIEKHIKTHPLTHNFCWIEIHRHDMIMEFLPTSAYFFSLHSTSSVYSFFLFTSHFSLIPKQQ